MVVSIIAILAAMLLPALSRARARVQLSQCNHNLKTFGMATVMYSDDHEEWFPDNYGPTCPNVQAASQIRGLNPSGTCWWCYKMWPYAPDLRFYYCTEQSAVAHTQTYRYGWAVEVCYGWNWELNARCRKRSCVSDAAELILMGHACRCDSNKAIIHQSMIDGGSWPGIWWPGWHGRRLAPPYTCLLGADGFLFADTHVEVLDRDAARPHPQYWYP